LSWKVLHPSSVVALPNKLGQPLPLHVDIPDHNGFPFYKPSFTLDIPPGNMIDENTDKYLEHIEQVYSQIVDRLRAWG
jgi:histone deacetylase 8